MNLRVRSDAANRTFPVLRQGSVMVMVAQDPDRSAHSEAIIPRFWDTSNRALGGGVHQERCLEPLGACAVSIVRPLTSVVISNLETTHYPCRGSWL